jgi:hypothetical protein
MLETDLADSRERPLSKSEQPGFMRKQEGNNRNQQSNYQPVE